jgi:hypothetical protein
LTECKKSLARLFFSVSFSRNHHSVVV